MNMLEYNELFAWEKRAMAETISALLFMTMTAPVPRPDWASRNESKSILTTEFNNVHDKKAVVLLTKLLRIF